MSDQPVAIFNPHLGKPASDAVAPSNFNVDPSDFKKFGYFAVLFYMLLSSMQIRQTTVITESKNISNNASLQNVLNNENANIKFSILPAGAGNPTINRVQTENQQYAALREDIQNNLITARQTGQVEMTRTSTNVNLLQQDASENSGWLQTLNTIYQVLVEMTDRK